MYFKRLEIFGFKSFAEKTVLNFEPGVTAIVGPNGCGKSNIFDAIRWVLGEQSVKELRGASMEDVIFNGTERSPSLGFAEVSVTFANESRQLPIDENEVIVTRRLFRSGESEYLINNLGSRLKDIQQLLMGTGIGAEAYSLIQQGKVDLVVSAKAEDRRMIFDEASGITKYKAQKKEALNKLKDTENNLLRVNDIIIELKRQISSVERQANKARKYKEEFEKLKDWEVRIAHYQISEQANKKNEIHSQIEELSAAILNKNSELEEISSVMTNKINFLDEIEEKINEYRSEQIKLEGQIDLNNRQIGFNHERIETLTLNDQKLKDQKENLIKRCKAQQEKVEILRNDLIALEANNQNNESTLKAKKENLQVLERLLKESRDRIREHEEKILSLTSQQVGIRNELTEVMKEVQGALARNRRLEMELEKVSQENNLTHQKIQNTDYQLVSVRGSMDELLLQKQNLLMVIDEIKLVIANFEHSIGELENKKLFLKSQKEFIEKMRVQYQDIPDPIVEGRFLTQTPPLEHHTGIIGKVKEVRTLDAEKMARLRETLNVESVDQFYEIICETKFIEFDPQQISNKIEEIGREIEGLSLKRSEEIVRLKDQEQIFSQLDENIKEKEKTFLILESQRKDTIEVAKKIYDELELIQFDLREVQESLTSLKKNEDELNFKFDTLLQDISWCQNDIKDKQKAVADKSQDREDTTIAIAQLETEIESNREKLKNYQDNINHFTEGLDSWLEEIKKIDDEIWQQDAKKNEYAQEIENLKIRLEEIKSSQERIHEELSGFEIQKTELGQGINALRTNINFLEEEIEKVKGAVHALELSEQELGFNEKGLKDRLLQTYKINIEEIPAEQLTLPATEDGILNPEQLLVEIERLRRRCEAFGHVNLVAIEEYEESKQRFEFLTKQQSDLIEAKSQLMNTITKINRSTRQMFLDTFTKVGEEFRIYFRMLFGGGEAELVLLDPENVLESGIEIIARPPGKKLQSISLMSGGEKTLTAIALIFGVFKVNPSPFCVLDEIDAALDDSNVGRFSFLLKDFSKIAQFIVITHNKKTIASANVMYGITMPETGISRIVSVKFADEEKKRESLPVAVGV